MTPESGRLYRAIWRWHFYVGLFVVPFILLLALTGAIYLFKPQLDAWQEREWRGFPVAAVVTPDAQLKAALAAVPGATFHTYRLPAGYGIAWHEGQLFGWINQLISVLTAAALILLAVSGMVM